MNLSSSTISSPATPAVATPPAAPTTGTPLFGTVLVANGFSCRHQVADALGMPAKHIVEILQPA